MKRRKYQASVERTVLTALVVHDGVLKTIYSEMGTEEEPFKSKWSNIVARWCFKYYAKQRCAPGKLLRELFDDYASKEEDEQAVELVGKFLESLNDDYVQLAKEINEPWVLDRAAEYFEKTRLERMADQIQIALERQDLDAARKFHMEVKPVSFSPDGWLNPFADSVIERTMDRLEKMESMVKFKGDLGRFLSPAFERDSFVTFIAPEKRGKSYWLMEIVWRAINQRRRTLYYVLGDMSEDQVYRRLYSRMTGLPKKVDEKHKDGYQIPTGIKLKGKTEDGILVAEAIRDTKILRAYNQQDVKRAVNRLKMNTAMSTNPLRIRCAGASTVSASQIERDVIACSEEGWPVDVVVLDYADLILPETSAAKLQPRDQINESWKIFRRISTEHHLSFIAATQSAARGYKKWLLKNDDFSEDKRKNAHVTGMAGINQTPDEKQMGIYRINWLFLRDGTWTENQCCWTAGNLAIANPCIRSLLP